MKKPTSEPEDLVVTTQSLQLLPKCPDDPEWVEKSSAEITGAAGDTYVRIGSRYFDG